MKLFVIYLKSQKLHLLTSVLLVIIPFIAVCLYLPYIPYTPYFFLIIIFFIKIIIQNDQSLSKKLKPLVQSELTKELKRNPSNSEIFKRISFYIRSRDLTLLLTGLSVMLISVIFNRF